jgi:pimeloyl-ACP methyl ester carboxylesterase
MRTRGTVRTPDGTGVAYQVEGDGHPLLVLTGQANNHHWWDVVWPDLAAYRTVSIDWRGTGFSADGPADFTTRSLAADVVDVVDPLDLRTVDVCGTSMVAAWRSGSRSTIPTGFGAWSSAVPPRADPTPWSEAWRWCAAAAWPVADPAAACEAVADPMYTPGWQADHPGLYATLATPASPRSARAGICGRVREKTHTRNFRRSRHPPSS